jgi:hypothetical protein
MYRVMAKSASRVPRIIQMLRASEQTSRRIAVQQLSVSAVDA